jgi:hypothetical protein
MPGNWYQPRGCVQREFARAGSELDGGTVLIVRGVTGSR